MFLTPLTLFSFGVDYRTRFYVPFIMLLIFWRHFYGITDKNVFRLEPEFFGRDVCNTLIQIMVACEKHYNVRSCKAGPLDGLSTAYAETSKPASVICAFKALAALFVAWQTCAHANHNGQIFKAAIIWPAVIAEYHCFNIASRTQLLILTSSVGSQGYGLNENGSFSKVKVSGKTFSISLKNCCAHRLFTQQKHSSFLTRYGSQLHHILQRVKPSSIYMGVAQFY